MAKEMRILQDIAATVGSARKKGQPDTVAIRTTISESEGIIRALTIAHTSR